MRQPACYRNGYHHTRTKAQRHNRWLLYLASALLLVGANRCAVSCRQLESVEQYGVLTVNIGFATLPV